MGGAHPRVRLAVPAPFRLYRRRFGHPRRWRARPASAEPLHWCVLARAIYASRRAPQRDTVFIVTVARVQAGRASVTARGTRVSARTSQSLASTWRSHQAGVRSGRRKPSCSARCGRSSLGGTHCSSRRRERARLRRSSRRRSRGSTSIASRRCRAITDTRRCRLGLAARTALQLLPRLSPAADMRVLRLLRALAQYRCPTQALATRQPPPARARAEHLLLRRAACPLLRVPRPGRRRVNPRDSRRRELQATAAFSRRQGMM